MSRWLFFCVGTINFSFHVPCTCMSLNDEYARQQTWKRETVILKTLNFGRPFQRDVIIFPPSPANLASEMLTRNIYFWINYMIFHDISCRAVKGFRKLLLRTIENHWPILKNYLVLSPSQYSILWWFFPLLIAYSHPLRNVLVFSFQFCILYSINKWWGLQVTCAKGFRHFYYK